MGGLEKDYNTSAISTDPANHQKMTIIRQDKINYIANCIPAQEVEGNTESADLLIVGWGGYLRTSTFCHGNYAGTRKESGVGSL
ncbi:2-oxoglutarate oxidoreductase subunit KorA [termite gut metagenome]|uniref:2-oxoglutarate oxidoreductase subunit KorA n=1 Tax=termite gut metagenome TaxID=433724 RepID=A0A5J4PLV6_9ZZZZ